MSRRFADATDRRIAVVGAASPAGTLVKSALADRGVPGTRVGLFGWTSEVAVLSEYDGEARLVQPVAELDASAHAAIVVCERGHDTESLARAAGPGTLVLDLSGSIEGAVLAGSPEAGAPPRLVAVAHPIAWALAAILRPLHAILEVERVSAVVLRPAADFGQAGLEELREQTIHLLRFEAVPKSIFGRQLAFNVIPETLMPDVESAASARIVAECRALLGAPSLPLHLSLVLVPVFLGHAIAVHVDLARGGAPEAAAALGAASGVTVSTDTDAGCTMDAPEGDGITVARLDAAGDHSVRIWALASDAGRATASQAIEVADAAGVL